MRDKKFITKSAKETQILAKKVIKNSVKGLGSIIIVLSGDLGSGKTVFAQGFAKELKINEAVLSPTFIVFRKYKIDLANFDYFYHFDLYRIENGQELEVLDFQKIISNSQNIILIEWAEKIKDILPKNTIFIDFKVIDNKTREIIIKNLKLET